MGISLLGNMFCEEYWFVGLVSFLLVIYSERSTGVLGGYQSCWFYALRGALVCWVGISLVGNMFGE